MMPHRVLLHRVLTPLAVLVFFTTGLFGPGFVGVAAAHPAPAQSANVLAAPQISSPDGDKLLLVHGFGDTCENAFNRTDEVPNTGLNARRTIEYLENNGWNASALDLIGYYDPNMIFDPPRYTGDHAPTTDGALNDYQIDPVPSDQYGTASYACTSNLQELGDTVATDLCSPLLNGHSAGSLNDPIEHLACLLAWYIYDIYGGRPVDILAHSMGGLIVRDAIGEAGHNTPDPNSPRFPPSPLNVHVVVTVGTPHGGLYGAYIPLAEQLYQVSTFNALPQEVQDMNSDPSYPHSFMTLLGSSPLQRPQGLFGTTWALMASSIPCKWGGHYLVPRDVANIASCNADNFTTNDPYPDGDGVVQADSALAMPADFKILYGAGTECSGSTPYCSNLSTAVRFDGGGLEYAHEANSCISVNLFAIGQVSGCLGQPFYLNDGTSGYTQGWECNAACTSGYPGPGGGGIVDMGVFNGSQPVHDSLAEIVALFGSNGTGTTASSACGGSTSGTPHNDFNGDGLSDAMGFYNLGYQSDGLVATGLYQWLSTGTGLNSRGDIFTMEGLNWYDAKWVSGDFNGDGKADLIAMYDLGAPAPQYVPAIGAYEWLSSGTGLCYKGQIWSSVGLGSFTWSYAQFLAGDFNGDGKTDIMAMYNLGSTIGAYEWLSTGTGLNYRNRIYTSGSFSWANAKWVSGDFNGDGKTDIVAAYNLGSTIAFYEWQSTGTGLTSRGPIWTSGSFCWSCSQFVADDFNGDGKTDILAAYNLGNGATAFYEWQSTGTGFHSLGQVWSSSSFTWANAQWMTGDFNGDGKADIMAFYNLGSTVGAYEWTSTGNSFSSRGRIYTSGTFTWAKCVWVS